MFNIFSKYDKHAQQPILGPTLMATRKNSPCDYPSRSPLERWRLAHNDRLESA